MLELIVEEKQRLKEFTENHYAQGSFFWLQLMKKKDVKVNGKKVGEDVLLEKGDRVAYYLTPKQEEKPAFFIVYEDENIVIVDKESGVNSEAVFAALKRKGETYFIHRLDRNTKGLMAFAKTPAANRALLASFKDRTAEKLYHALCFGKPQKSSDTLTAYLKKDGEKALVKIFDTPTVCSETIVTAYRVLDERPETTLLEVTLHTGKTHQIRAHLAHIGVPVVGDMKYGDEQKNRALGISRQLLVSKSLRLTLEGELSYLNGKTFLSRFEASLPDNK